MDWFLIWLVPRSVIPASTRMLISQSLSIIASSLLCCLAVVSRCMLQHNSLICDWLWGLLWLVGIVVRWLVDGYGHNFFVALIVVSCCVVVVQIVVILLFIFSMSIISVVVVFIVRE